MIPRPRLADDRDRQGLAMDLSQLSVFVEHFLIEADGRFVGVDLP
jgi:hypothetical protein